MDVLSRIKELVRAGQVAFTEKADLEIEASNLTRELVTEAIAGASAISKTLRSRNPRTGRRERLYVIKGLTPSGIAVYTKGKIATEGQQTVFYVLISSKRATDA